GRTTDPGPPEAPPAVEGGPRGRGSHPAGPAPRPPPRVSRRSVSRESPSHAHPADRRASADPSHAARRRRSSRRRRGGALHLSGPSQARALAGARTVPPRAVPRGEAHPVRVPPVRRGRAAMPGHGVRARGDEDRPCRGAHPGRADGGPRLPGQGGPPEHHAGALGGHAGRGRAPGGGLTADENPPGGPFIIEIIDVAGGGLPHYQLVTLCAAGPPAV